MSTDTAFPFQTCQAADPAACRSAIAGILRPGMDWSEVHCGRCGAQGIVRHADLSPAPAAPLLASPEPGSDPLGPEPAPKPKGQPLASPGPAKEDEA